MTATPIVKSTWPITLDDVRAAEARIRPHLPVTPLRGYGPLEDAVGRGIRVLVKHENHNPTNSFKARNGLSFMTALTPAERARGVIAASRGNHGLGLAWAGALLGVRVTVCVPTGNNPEKNAWMRSLGARVLEEGRDYDESVAAAARLAAEQGLLVAHSTNDARVIAGAATMTLELLQQEPALDAIVLGVGGGSQAVGALTVARAVRPSLAVYGVQAAGASAAHDSWHSGRVITSPAADTFADGLATRSAYALTFPALREGLAGFITVTDRQLAESLRLILRTTHNLVEGAGAAGVAGVIELASALEGRKVAVVLSGANIDAETLRRVVAREI